MLEPGWPVASLGQLDGQQDLKPSRQLSAQVADLEGVEGISASAISHQREGEGEERCMLDVVYPEPRYGMHVGVFCAVHGEPNAV